MELYEQGRAPRLLLSTLSADSLDLARFAALNLPDWPRLLALQGQVPKAGRLFFLDYDGAAWHVDHLPVRPLGTMNEIAGLAAWLGRHHDVRSVLIVSSAGHLRRIRACCRALIPATVQCTLMAAPHDRLPQDSSLSEWAKLALYRVVLAFRRTAA